MVAKRLRDIAAGGDDPEAFFPRIGDQRLDQFLRNAASAQFGRREGVVGDAHIVAACLPRQFGFRFAVGDLGDVTAALALVLAADGDGGLNHGSVSV
jgi:hypothetical protein